MSKCPPLTVQAESKDSAQASFALGWFWGPDAAFRKLKGVTDCVCVYVGGTTENPTYNDISDYTEGVTVTFNPTVISYEKLLAFFFTEHNPFSACSSSRQYMSGVWWHNPGQQAAIEKFAVDLEAKNKRKVTTYRAPLDKLYRAEEYHQQYYAKHSFKWVLS